MIPARETIYRGIKMRSRLEARFAGILDGYGLDWEYEPRAFAAGGTQYLPDFLVHRTYIEVRPIIERLAFERMGAILESEPDASLAIACPKFGRLLAISTPLVAVGVGALGPDGVMPFGPSLERLNPQDPQVRAAFTQQIGTSLADVAISLTGLVGDAGWGWDIDRGAA